jgi:hypothetical protein
MQAVHYRKLKAAIASGIQPYSRELTSLVSALCASAARVPQAALARMLCRILGCAPDVAPIVLPPLALELNALLSKLARGGRAGASAAEAHTLRRLHSVLVVLVPVVKQPVGKALLLERGAAGVLGSVLHQAVRVWNEAQDAGSGSVGDYKTVARLVLEAIRAICNPQARASPFHGSTLHCLAACCVMYNLDRCACP